MLDSNEQAAPLIALAAFRALTPAQQAAAIAAATAQALTGLNALRSFQGLAPLASLPP